MTTSNQQNVSEQDSAQFGSGYVYVLCSDAQKNPLYNTWMEHTVRPCRVVENYISDWQPPDDCDLLITHLHYRWEDVHILKRVMDRKNIPVLVLADGVLEYRNTWEHPSLADGSMFQPLMGHKLACIGKSQARIVESWGNQFKCEIVGLPRMDRFLEMDIPGPKETGPFDLLVTTAKTPAFDTQQEESLLESLVDLKYRLDRNPYAGGRELRVTWRLSDELYDRLEIDRRNQNRDIPLSEELLRVDGVFTTPSTLFLEAALLNRPVAVLDYFNGPQFVPPAWKISAPKNINPVLEELVKPPKPKLLFQDFILHDTLECWTNARQRMLYLIREMLRAKELCRRQNRPLAFPKRIIQDVFEPDVPSINLSELFADSRPHQIQEVERLQSELSQAITRLDTLPDDLVWRDQLISTLMQRNVDISNRLLIRNQTIAEMSDKLKELMHYKEKYIEQVGDFDDEPNDTAIGDEKTESRTKPPLSETETNQENQSKVK